jgi:acetyl esterase/lipase
MRIIAAELAPNGATLTAYLPDASPETPTAAVRPIVLILPGGAYQFTSDREAEPIALAYLAHGYAAGVLRYTTGPSATFAAALADAEAAMAAISAHSADWAVDSAKIAAVGFSAGGHLAACLGTMGATRPSALVLGYPLIDPGSLRASTIALPSPLGRVDDRTPPTFVFATADDAVVPIHHSLLLAEALAAHSVPFALHVFRSADHGVSLAEAHTAAGQPRLANAEIASWLPLSLQFLKDTWGDFPLGPGPAQP